MPSVLSKNCILSGLLDYYCLICEKHFRNEEETVAHMVDSLHKENLTLGGYFEKFKEDMIRKIKGLYFCELCSMTFPTTAKVGLHVTEESHVTKKKNITQVVRMDNNVIAFHRFLITEESWNGLINETCVLCNAEIDDKNTHKVSQSHILKLINSKVMVGGNETIYRKIDDRLYQCLTCNKLVSGDKLSHHFDTAEHKKAHKIYDSTLDQPVITSENIAEHGKGTKSVDLKFDNDIKQIGVTNKPKQSVDSFKKNTAAELDDIYCINLGAKNYIIDHIGKEWCLICEWFLDAPAQVHIRSKHHQALLKMHKERIEQNANNKNNVTSNDNKTDLFDYVERYQKNNVNIDLINETAFCKRCSQNVDLNTEAIEKHIEAHKKNKKSQENSVPFLSGIKSSGTDRTTLFTKPVLLTNKDKKPRSRSFFPSTEMEDFASQHGLAPNRADNSFYCNACSRRLSAMLKDLEKHVSSSGHKEKISIKSFKIQIEGIVVEKEPIFKFIKRIDLVESETGVNIIINKKYCMNADGFCLLARYHNKIVCHACDIDLLPENFYNHIMRSETHKNVVGKCLFITSLENEFIREIKLEVYHCGYCNIVENNWEDILEHLAMEEHKKSRLEAQQNLRNHALNSSRDLTEEVNAIFQSIIVNQFGFKLF